MHQKLVIGLTLGALCAFSSEPLEVEAQPLEMVFAQSSAEDFYQQGRKKYLSKDYKEAIQAFTQAVRLDPEHSQAYYERGISHISLGNVEGAISDYTDAIRINPNFALAYWRRGVDRFHFFEEKKSALTDYTRAIQLDPKLPHARYSRGYLLAELGNKQAAIRDFQIALQLFKQQGDTRGSQATQDQIEKLQQK